MIVALSQLDAADGPHIDALVEYARAYFGLPVRVWRGLDVDDLQPRRRTHQGQSQLNATGILDALEAKVPTDAYCVIALTTEDLYPDDTFNFVFGMARLKARVGVFSFARYGAEQPRLAVQRAFKIMTHELGHMFGMGHCTHFACNMNGGNHLQELDATPMHLCPVCLRKLHMAVGFDPMSRYQALRGAYGREGLQAEVEWVDRRLEYLATTPADR